MTEGIAEEIGRTITDLRLKAVYADMGLEDLAKDPKGITRQDLKIWKVHIRETRKTLVNVYDKLMDMGVTMN